MMAKYLLDILTLVVVIHVLHKGLQFKNAVSCLITVYCFVVEMYLLIVCSIYT